tara:strand:- start:463 stop:615 length:153 start_codon:yes stop_codon:yes gene_type:complete
VEELMSSVGFEPYVKSPAKFNAPKKRALLQPLKLFFEGGSADIHEYLEKY